MLPSRRVLIAGGLTAAAVCLPCVAWYVAGSHGLSREVDRLLAEPVRQAKETAERLAERIGGRLERLRAEESTRPYQHYTHQFEESLEDCACPVLATSPLAGGWIDPLVLTHFQIRAGSVFLPALAVEQHDPIARQWQDSLYPVRADLIAARDSLLRGFRLDDDSPPDVPGAVDERLLMLGPFEWRAIAVGGEPTLAAVREVSTSVDTRVQGFVVAMDVLADSIGAGSFPVRIGPGYDPDDPASAPLILGDLAWVVRVDPTPALETAGEQVRRSRVRFLGSFLLGLLAALVAGAAIVGLVWQSERISGMRSRFAAAAAHELRSPLAGIRLYGEMLADGLGRPERTREYAARVAREADQLGRVVTNVLGYARLEQGRLPVRPRPGDLAGAVRAVVERLRPGIEAAGALIDLDLPAELPSAVFDPDAVHHIVQNLVDNAERHTRNSRTEDRVVRLALSREDGQVWLSVGDRGPGLPPSFPRGVLRPRRLDRLPGSDDGLGLGLRLVAALTLAHGGELSCRDRPGGGAEFRVSFTET